MSSDYDLLCVICADLVSDAYQTSCCGSLFCKSCISSWVNRGSIVGRTQSCPTCRTQLTNSMIVPDVRSDRKSAEHIRHCPFHAEFGCAFAGNRREVSSHQDTCTYKPVVSQAHNYSQVYMPSLSGALHFLIVLQNEVQRKLVTLLLRRAGGHSAEVAGNGAEALERIHESVQPNARPFDGILMDIQMSVMDGFTAIERLRQLESVGAAAARTLGRSVDDTSSGGGASSSSGSSTGSTDPVLGANSDTRNSSTLPTTQPYTAHNIATASQTQIQTQAPTHIQIPYSKRHIVVAISANSVSDIEPRAYEAGADWVMEQPFQAAEFLNVINRCRLP
jgi:CheY-like chemotaxis protein